MSSASITEIRFDFAACRIIGLVLTLAIGTWMWAHGNPAAAGAGFSGALVIVFWRELRMYRVTALHLYLLFTVVFYSHRYLFKWGDPDTLTFREQAPDWVRVSKDVVWLAFLVYVGILWLSGKRRLCLRQATAPLIAIGFFVVLMFGTFVRAGDLSADGILFYLRYPLEYIPAALLAPLLLSNKRELIATSKAFHALLFVILGFLAYEAATGAENGYNWGPGIRRYGSIFGSPLDLGMFCVFYLVFLLCLWPHIRLPRVKKLVAALGVTSMLLLTVSFGALFAAAVSLAMWACLSRNAWRYGLIVAFLLIGGYTLSRSEIFPYLPNRFEDIIEGRDQSSFDRLYMSQKLLREINTMSAEDRLIGVSDALDVSRMYTAGRRRPFTLEVYYVRIFLGQGVLGLIALLSMGVTLALAHLRAWRSSADPVLRQTFLACFICTVTMFAAMTTHPRLDMFPTNFYFWLISGVSLVDFEATEKAQHKPDGT